MRAFAWVGLGAALVSGPAFGFAVPVPRSQLCAWSDLTVVVDVARQEVRWAQGPRGDLETVSDLVAVRVVHGVAPSDLFVRALGGALGGMVQRVEDSPQLEVGGRYLLMLRRASDGDGWTVVGGEAGAIQLERGQHRGETETGAVASLGACHAP